mgnify:CR=1 FL=1
MTPKRFSNKLVFLLLTIILISVAINYYLIYKQKNTEEYYKNKYQKVINITNVPTSKTPSNQGNKPIPAQKCQVENCHGLDITCGPNEAQMCTMMYQIGDGCRQFAKCEVTANGCQQAVSPKFEECKTCVEKCMDIYQNSVEKQFECENKCIN